MVGLSVGMAIACVVTVYVGATVQASIGIGLGMIASPVLALADPDFIPAAIVIAVMPLTFAVAWADREHVEPRGGGFALLGRIPGVVRGALVVAALSDQVLALRVAVQRGVCEFTLEGCEVAAAFGQAALHVPHVVRQWLDGQSPLGFELSL